MRQCELFRIELLVEGSEVDPCKHAELSILHSVKVYSAHLSLTFLDENFFQLCEDRGAFRPLDIVD